MKEFENDLGPLLRAFFPGEETQVSWGAGAEGPGQPAGGTGAEGPGQPAGGAGAEDPGQPAGGTADVSCIFESGGARLCVFGTEEFVPGEFGAGRLALKNDLKRAMYRLLSQKTGKQLPWGTLTGIRPTKLAYKGLMEGRSPEELAAWLQKDYYMSREKAAVSLEIAGTERALVERLPKDGLPLDKTFALYIGIPFCPSICLYCSFSSFAIDACRDMVEPYLDALFFEIEKTAELFAAEGKKPAAVYFGGGTPSSLAPEQMRRLLRKVKSCFDMSMVREVTFEAGRPDSLFGAGNPGDSAAERGYGSEKLAILREEGVGRISINPQSMNQKTLEFIGRRHTPGDVEAAVRLARDAGFSDINMDLILGLPGEGLDAVSETLSKVRALAPENLTVHSLALKRKSRLYLEWEKYRNLSFENTREIMDAAYQAARGMGLSPYYLYRQKDMAGNLENVGFCAPGKEGWYNVLIMEELCDILALGAGAASKRVFAPKDIRRCENVKDVGHYIKRVEEMVERKAELWRKQPAREF